jgi:hypothetical protein
MPDLLRGKISELICPNSCATRTAVKRKTCTRGQSQGVPVSPKKEESEKDEGKLDQRLDLLIKLPLISSINFLRKCCDLKGMDGFVMLGWSYGSREIS